MQNYEYDIDYQSILNACENGHKINASKKLRYAAKQINNVCNGCVVSDNTAPPLL